MHPRFILKCAVASLFAVSTPALAQSDAQELAKQLANPIASLIQVPIQQNFDGGFGQNDGIRSTTNIQPVVPISLGKDWNVISRTILPVIYQDDVTAQGVDQFGLGDTVQSLFISPKEVGSSGIIWGAGPVFLLPTATDGPLGSKKWGAGPTAVVLKQSHHLTVGALVNHVWSFAGDDDRSRVSSTFMQPFVTYTTTEATTFALNTETTYDWVSDRWQIPINLTVNQLTSVGKQPVQIGAGARYYAKSVPGGPNWGMRMVLTYLFPKK